MTDLATDLGVLAQETADALTARKHLGVVVAAISGDTVEIRGAGRTARGGTERPGPDTLFEIGSITKVFTSLTLARLALAGTVDLAEPIADLLPPWAHVPSRDGVQITLEHLATHTSGLPRLPQGMFLKGLLRPNAPDPYAGCTADFVLRGLADTKLGAVPGRRFRYSNLGAGLLGMGLAERTGLDYPALIDREILTPLGMTDTLVDIDPARIGRLAEGHNRRGRPVPPWDLAALAGAGGLRASTADLAVFLRAQLRPGDGGFADAVRLTREVDVKSNPFLHAHLGWMSVNPRGTDYRQYWHNGGTGGFASFVGFTPTRDAGVVVLSNTCRGFDRQALELLGKLDARHG